MEHNGLEHDRAAILRGNDTGVADCAAAVDEQHTAVFGLDEAADFVGQRRL